MRNHGKMTAVPTATRYHHQQMQRMRQEETSKIQQSKGANKNNWTHGKTSQKRRII
jgi:hypothetical protein